MMLAANLAVVHKVVPERHGVLVTYRSGVPFANMDPGNRFVRVLATRAHPTGGSVVSLPGVGELGLVLDVDEENSIWVGSIHWLLGNQAEPTEGLWSWTHESGLSAQLRPNGDFQIDHSSGVRIRISEEDEVLPTVQNTTAPGGGFMLPVMLEVYHPSGAQVTISAEGKVDIYAPDNLSISTDADLSVDVAGNTAITTTGTINVAQDGGGSIQVDAGGNLTVAGFASQKYESGAAPFCMKPLWDWAKNHKHPGNNLIPTEPPPNSGLSPSTFTGPTG